MFIQYQFVNLANAARIRKIKCRNSLQLALPSLWRTSDDHANFEAAIIKKIYIMEIELHIKMSCISYRYHIFLLLFLNSLWLSPSSRLFIFLFFFIHWFLLLQSDEWQSNRGIRAPSTDQVFPLFVLLQLICTICSPLLPLLHVELISLWVWPWIWSLTVL